jgi:hypothetical protein
MVFRYWIFSACVLAAFGAGYLAADRGAAAKDAQRAGIFADEKDGVVRIVAGGREVVVIDESGLYVRGDVAYTGALFDGLPSRFDKEGGHAQ